MQLEEPLDANPAQPEHLLWITIIERAVLDARSSSFYAHSARALLLDSPEFSMAAFYAGSSDPETLRSQIRRGLDQQARASRSTPRWPRLPSVTILTAPPGMPMWEIVEKTARAAARAVN